MNTLILTFPSCEEFIGYVYYMYLYNELNIKNTNKYRRGSFPLQSIALEELLICHRRRLLSCFARIENLLGLHFHTCRID